MLHFVWFELAQILCGCQRLCEVIYASTLLCVEDADSLELSTTSGFFLLLLQRSLNLEGRYNKDIPFRLGTPKSLALFVEQIQSGCGWLPRWQSCHNIAPIRHLVILFSCLMCLSEPVVYLLQWQYSIFITLWIKFFKMWTVLVSCMFRHPVFWRYLVSLSISLTGMERNAFTNLQAMLLSYGKDNMSGILAKGDWSYHLLKSPVVYWSPPASNCLW